MSRGLFSNQNQVGESYSFTTNKNGIFYWYIDKHDPTQYPADRSPPPTPTPSRNIRIDYGDGSQPESPLLTNRHIHIVTGQIKLSHLQQIN